MNDKQRFHAIMNFEPPDRMLYWEQGFWGGTVERWYTEGMPMNHGVDGNPLWGETVRGPATPIRPQDRFSRDVIESTGLDKPSLKVPVELYICPGFEEQILEKKDERLLVRDQMGITKYITDNRGTVPHFVAWPIQSMEDFEQLAAERLNPDTVERFPPDWQQHVERLNSYDGVVSIGGSPCGFFGAPRYLMGEIGLMMGYLDNPELIRRMTDHLADLWVAIFDRVLSEVKLDCIHLWEDMSYKNGPLISPALVEEFMVPAYRKVTDVARSHGVNVVLLDTDGDCTKLIPEFLKGGITGLYPFEVQAGMDVKSVREAFPRLQILGGIDKKEVALGPQHIDRELERRLPGMVEGGGYIPMLDHQVPPDVSFENYRYYRKRIAELTSA